jgi:hypothetical protein
VNGAGEKPHFTSSPDLPEVWRLFAALSGLICSATEPLFFFAHKHQHTQTSPPPFGIPATMEYKQEDHASAREEEDDEDEVESECSHQKPHVPESTLRVSDIHGAPKCGHCGLYLYCEQAHTCTKCDGVFCTNHKFKPRRQRLRKSKSQSSKRITRPHLPKFIKKLEIPSYLYPGCDRKKQGGLEPDVELFIAWAKDVWAGMSDGEQADVPKATIDLVRQRWESNFFQDAASDQEQLSEAPPQQLRHAAPARRVHGQPRQLPHRQRQQQAEPPLPVQTQQCGQLPLHTFGYPSFSQDDNMGFANTRLTSTDHQKGAQDGQHGNDNENVND